MGWLKTFLQKATPVQPVKTGALIFVPQYQMYFWCDAYKIRDVWIFKCSEGFYNKPGGTYTTDADVTYSNKTLSWSERETRVFVADPDDVKIWEGSVLWLILRGQKPEIDRVL